MKKQLDAVKAFHEAFEEPNGKKPQLLKQEMYELRHRIMMEEVNEYLEACQKQDIVEIADALGDQLYILCGTLLKHGLQHKIEEVFDEIHRSNMSKLGKDGKPIRREDGKIIKGPGYFPPDLKPIVGKIDSFFIGDNKCPYCNNTLDVTTSVNKEPVIPVPGDFTVCLYCGGILQFADDMELLKVSDEVFNSLDENTKEDLKAVQEEIRKLRGLL